MGHEPPDVTDDMDSPDDGPEGEDAFALVGNEVRAEIVRALGDARVEERSPTELSFSELRSQVDVDVRSSRFNYHLQRLVGHFLERTEDGYWIRPEGWVLYRTLRAGTFDRERSESTVDAGLDCYYCGESVQAIFEGGLVTVQCPGCDYLYDVVRQPPGTGDGGETDLANVSEYTHHKHLGFARGVCPTCGSALETKLLEPEESPFPGADRRDVHVYRVCDGCGGQRYLSLGEALLDDPGLIAFYHEHGQDVLSTPLWELEFAATDRGVTVRSTDPWEVALAVELDGDTLELVVDGDLSVVERNRS